MLVELIIFVFGMILLVKGADFLINGSSSLAKKIGVSDLVIGLTIVAFGTSAPELVVSTEAAIKGSSEMALGNIIGSSLANTLLILGAAALTAPLVVQKGTVNKEIPFSLLAIIAVFLLANDTSLSGSSVNIISRADGFILLLFFIIFIYYTFGISKAGIMETIRAQDDAKEQKIVFSALMILVGLAGLVYGGKLAVDSGIAIAQILGMSEKLIGLTLVAVGTSLPELATSIMAVRKGNTDIAVGNVVGSNVFNLLLVLGASAAIHPIAYDLNFNTDVILLIIVTVITILLIYIGKKNILARYEGSVLLLIYLVYIGFLIFRG